MSPEVRRRWLLHLAVLGALLLTWGGLAWRAHLVDRSSPVRLEVFGVVLLGLLGSGYALVTTLAMLWLRRRPYAPAIVHGGAALLLLVVRLGGGALTAHQREAERASSARAEAAERAETRRLETCLGVDRPRLLLGRPLRVELTLRNGDCPPLEISSLTFSGNRGRGDSLLINHFPEPRLRLAQGASAKIALTDDRDLLSAEGWDFSVEVHVDRPELLFLLYCGPGARSPVEEVRPCRPLAAPEAVPGAP